MKIRDEDVDAALLCVVFSIVWWPQVIAGLRWIFG